MNLDLIFSKLNWDIESLSKNSTVTFLNPYSYLLLRKTHDLNDMDCVGIDGVLLKIIFNFFFHYKVKRRSFDETSLAPVFYDFCIKNNKSVYFLGSTKSYINAFIKVISKELPELNILGYRDGYFFTLDDKKATMLKINKLNPDFVVVGMGAPYQESFMSELKKSGFIGRSISCGGYIHQTSKKTSYYPKFFNKFNLRWVYRIIDEPKLFKRYFVFYPISIFYILKDILKYKFKHF